ncbi:MAG: collagen-binding protein [Saprospiraceae bacterium]|nr:MAG: collagen-binding protein [Saprospiraceae bacterium]
MNNQEGNNVFTWLQRWISPDGNREDEANLEGQVGEDPFLADAMEGYRQFPEYNHTTTLAEVRARIQPEAKPEKVNMLFLSRIAAAFLFIVIAVVGFYYLNTGDKPSGLAEQPELQQTETTLDEVSTATDKPADTNTASQEEPGIEKIAVEREAKPNTQAEEIAKLEETDDEVGELPKQIAGNARLKPIPQIDGLEATPLESNKERAASGIQPPTNADWSNADFFKLEDAGFDTATAPASPQEPQYVQGFVQDEIGDPISGARVVVPGTSIGTVTGIDGRFSLKWDKSYNALQFQYLGFASQTKTINGPDTIKVVLNGTDVALQNTAVTSQPIAERESKKKDVAKTSQPKPIEANPSGGYNRLERYLKKNLEKPAENIVGQVKLQFIVHPNGTLTDFKVLQSLCAACDQEAIRLLTNGPKWQIDKGEEPVIQTYTVQFD